MSSSVRAESGTWRLVAAVVAVATAASVTACNPKEPPAKQVLDFGYYDADANETVTLVDGGSTQAVADHEQQVTFRSKDPKGVKKVATWGVGWLKCTARDGSQIWTAKSPIQVMLPRVESTLNDGLYYGFAIGKLFKPRGLSCGVHTYGGPNKPLEYFANSGTIHIYGETTNHAGEISQVMTDLTF